MAVNVKIISGEHKGKVGELSGVLHGCGIALVKTPGGEEIAVRINEVTNINNLNEYIVSWKREGQGELFYDTVEAVSAQDAVDEVRNTHFRALVYSVSKITRDWN
jgi:hypothetical protein